MISLELAGGLERNIKFTTLTYIFSLAESLGGIESLLGHPITIPGNRTWQEGEPTPDR